MKHALATIIFALFCSVAVTPLFAASFKQPPKSAELKLAYGVNEIKVGTISLRVVRAQVATLSASDFDTYTVFLASQTADEPWMHVTAPESKGIGFSLRDYETADANTQATAFYRDNGRLYAVQAIKVGPVANASGPLETLFDFKVYAFNGNAEVPMFAHEGTMRAKRRFVDGREALVKDFFKP